MANANQSPIDILADAAESWATNGDREPDPADVWERIWAAINTPPHSEDTPDATP